MLRTSAVLLASAVSVMVSVLPAAANPPGYFTGHNPASILPTPLAEPFYRPPLGFESQPPGTVLARRPVFLWFAALFADSTELLIRSTDSKDRPVPVVATVIQPRARWSGPGSRPLVAYNSPISAIGNDCAPSQQLRRGLQKDEVPILELLQRGYAVVIPDHQGPRQAYAAGPMGGHAALDAMRAAVHFDEKLPPQTPIVSNGYSGGAIAAGWAAQLAGTYAPELHLVGSLVGGTPADYFALHDAMNGTVASGVFLAATLGVAREYPEMLALLNEPGWELAQTFRDLCTEGIGLVGAVAEIPIERLVTSPHPLDEPVVRDVVAQNTLGGAAPNAPVFLYHGQQEFWLPIRGVENLDQAWCRRGGQVRFERFFGEHFIVGGVSQGILLGDWVDRMLRGTLVPPGCTTNG